MALSLKPDHLKRYRDIALLLMRYGDRDLVNTASLDEALLLESDESKRGDTKRPEQFAADLEKLGPTFIKLGQLLSTRPDLIPESYTRALARLQDDVEPVPFNQINAVIQTELGTRISKAFATFEEEPIAAASLAQVHRGTLRDGRAVAVKVQRPGIRQTIFDDLEALGEVVDTVATHTDVGRRYAVDELLGEFRSALIRELDFRLEAQNLGRLREDIGNYSNIVVPEPIEDYTTSRLLTMEFIDGDPIMSIGPLRMLELEGRQLAEDLTRAYLDQVLLYGFFHADPHPGNVMITRDGRLALIDLGMVARLGPEDRQQLLKLLIAMTEARGRDAAELAIQMGRPMQDFDEPAFIARVETLITMHIDDEMRDVNVGRLLLEVLRASGESGLRPPRSMALLGKTMLNLDEISRKLAPDMQPREVTREHASGILQQRMTESLAPSNVFSSLLEAQELARKLPPRINVLSEKLANDRFTLRIEAVDEPHVLRNLHRMVNRISLALVLAALIIGAAMMMQIDTDFEIFGYPGLAAILFLAAVACGFILVVSIFLGENQQRGHRQ